MKDSRRGSDSSEVRVNLSFGLHAGWAIEVGSWQALFRTAPRHGRVPWAANSRSTPPTCRRTRAAEHLPGYSIVSTHGALRSTSRPASSGVHRPSELKPAWSCGDRLRNDMQYIKTMHIYIYIYLIPYIQIGLAMEQLKQPFNGGTLQVYGVSIVVAQSCMELCSLEFMNKGRLIDRVLLAGSSVPMRIYCVDLDFLSRGLGRAARCDRSRLRSRHLEKANSALEHVRGLRSWRVQGKTG